MIDWGSDFLLRESAFGSRFASRFHFCNNALHLQRIIMGLMKTATFPSLRVEPELRQAAETVLREGESLSSFVEESIRASVERRKSQSEFIARGLISRDEAKRTGKYFAAEEVHAELDTMLAAAERKAGKTKSRG